jgi:hypothetical protein
MKKGDSKERSKKNTSLGILIGITRVIHADDKDDTSS